ncbi:MAG: PAS domain S-box protein [Bacteroidales bacterium]|nr:PAS domain S-box protein [Bacteroidales bacterium]
MGIKNSSKEGCVNSEDLYLKENSNDEDGSLSVSQLLGHEQLLCSMFNELNINIVFLDRNACIVNTNKFFSSTLGYAKEELLNKSYLDIIEQDKKEITVQLIDALFTSKLSNYKTEIIHYKKDSSPIYLKISGMIIKDEKQTAKYILGVGEDITEVKRYKSINNIVNNISNAVNYSHNLNEVIDIVKMHLAPLLDTKHFFINLYNELSNSYGMPYFSDNQFVFKTDKTEQALADFVCKNKKAVLLDARQIQEIKGKTELSSLLKQWIGVPLIDNYKVIGIMGVKNYVDSRPFTIDNLKIFEIISHQITTIVQKIHSESILRIERAYFKELFDHSPEAIAIVNNSGKIMTINNEFQNLFGYTKSQAIDCFINNLISPDDLKQIAFEAVAKVAKGEVVKTKSRCKKKDGTIIHVSIWGNPIYLNQGTLAIYAIFRDITEQVEAEQKLKEAKERAEESEKLKTAFLANMSHEVRTPLNAIVGFSDLLADPNVDLDTRKEFIEQINISSEMLIKLIDNIIDISQIDTGDLKIYKTRFNVMDILADSYEKIQKDKIVELKENIDIILNVPNKRDAVYINSDQMRFRQIIEHLLSNALKYTHQGFIEFGLNITNNMFPEFYVRDTGIGISTNKKETIFNYFTKIENKTKHYRGTGIGLTVTKKLIELLGGKINVNSELGVGSVFSFVLPEKVEIDSINYL